MSQFKSKGKFLDFNRVLEIEKSDGLNLNLSPRKQTCGIKLGSNKPMTKRRQYIKQGSMNSTYGWQYIKDVGYRETLPSRKKMYDTLLSYGDFGCLMLMDTDRERKAGIGATYRHKAMNKGECTIS
jgi:hypothetical protein